MSTKALLSVLTTASSCVLPCVFHMDSTFKCNENEFPVTLLGISDARIQFHLLSISVVSPRTQAVYRCEHTCIYHMYVVEIFKRT